ncbi:hypothetical protein LWI29_037065 [Acer saccharum]|uniref:Uncharacterized protein n=1 Tax=Acer saccharum TaxID=4024 RepID=A0AA39TK67_ACESA|nr:hypothetical protein LWI29_037065 [Acer saccharum]
MEIIETTSNPVSGENVLIQKEATRVEDSRGKSMNQKKWKRLAREKRESVQEGSLNLGKRDGDMEIDECSERKRISVGSLGKKLQEAGVENVIVKSVTFRGTENGVRIKSWGRPSNGFSRNIVFQHVLMIDVQNPIIIDQNYCPDSKNCPHQVSGVQISDVTYKDIHGTSASEVAVK